MENPVTRHPSPLTGEDTICAPATAVGGALAVIRISGPASFPIVSTLCSLCCGAAAANTAHFTRLTAPPQRDAVPPHRELIDEALVTVFRAPHSYTGEDSVEISCHGSTYIVRRILDLLIQNGCRMARPGEFTMRAYLNGKLDLSQAEAVADLIASTNQATHRLAMSQLRGGISSELAALREQLLKLTSLLELELDFSDHEDLEFADRTELLALAQKIDAHITRLTDSFNTGNALKNGIPVAIVGAPNVGKSTLLNALLGEERAIVSDIQGTTRDAIEDTIQLGGITFRFIDTAGIRHTDDKIELMGIDRSIAAAQRARIILMMTEPGVPYPDIPVRNDQTVITVCNKSDLDSPSPVCCDSVATPPTPISAKFGVGLDALRQQLLDAAPKTTDSDVIVTNARHYEVLTRAQAHLRRVLDGLSINLSGDLLSEDLRLTLDTLAEITGGQITPNEVLGNIFKNFCVGK